MKTFKLNFPLLVGAPLCIHVVVVVVVVALALAVNIVDVDGPSLLAVVNTIIVVDVVDPPPLQVHVFIGPSGAFPFWDTLPTFTHLRLPLPTLTHLHPPSPILAFSHLPPPPSLIHTDLHPPLSPTLPILLRAQYLFGGKPTDARKLPYSALDATSTPSSNELQDRSPWQSVDLVVVKGLSTSSEGSQQTLARGVSGCVFVKDARKSSCFRHETQDFHEEYVLIVLLQLCDCVNVRERRRPAFNSSALYTTSTPRSNELEDRSPGIASTLSWSRGSSTSESDPLREANRRLLTARHQHPTVESKVSWAGFVAGLGLVSLELGDIDSDLTSEIKHDFDIELTTSPKHDFDVNTDLTN
ncbi:uncharacterized protein STEHIDRAFT_159393 [Stereum hirsutum FP-91666 SS1]|uniref:uncharacterized protein n=1 Tax=Stereum hirsutum (strain FP-91666) TaxID=721885 RepID=UPI000444A88B|nr:uncharacterized protein STEHIDRAFT_159393 [Stereum hirsutum FP-91666 SS1]EIM83769.1 hypothetical protein STEHIDRAFT_159393 [Stereum hirsutum FP-91666 SS1]